MPTIYFLDDDLAMASSILEYRATGRFGGFKIRGARTLGKLMEQTRQDDPQEHKVFVLDSNMPLELDEADQNQLFSLIESRYHVEPDAIVQNPHRRGVLMAVRLKHMFPLCRIIILSGYYRSIEKDMQDVPAMAQIVRDCVDVMLSKQTCDAGTLEANIEAQIDTFRKDG